jgi:hypothetical protein
MAHSYDMETTTAPHCSGCCKSLDKYDIDADGYSACCNKRVCYGGAQCDCFAPRTVINLRRGQ